MANEPKVLNLAAKNGADPAEPEDEGQRDEWLQGDLDLRDRKREDFEKRRDDALAFYQGQDDSENTAKPTRVSTSHPSAKGKGDEGK